MRLRSSHHPWAVVLRKLCVQHCLVLQKTAPQLHRKCLCAKDRFACGQFLAIEEKGEAQPFKPRPQNLLTVSGASGKRALRQERADPAPRGSPIRAVPWYPTPLDKGLYRREDCQEVVSPTSAVKWNLAEGNFVDLDIKESGNICALKLKGKLICGEPVSQFEGAFHGALSSTVTSSSFSISRPCRSSTRPASGSLVSTLRTAAKVGGGVKLVNPAEFVHKMLKMVGVYDLFEVYSSEEDAVAACA